MVTAPNVLKHGVNVKKYHNGCLRMAVMLSAPLTFETFVRSQRCFT